jgi:hypothetical protein
MNSDTDLARSKKLIRSFGGIFENAAKKTIFGSNKKLLS